MTPWPLKFEDRLQDWHNLRHAADHDDPHTFLLHVNNWWMRAPINGYYLHWDYSHEWPGPWQLLSDNVWCDLARCLGIVYTLTMTEKFQFDSIKIIQFDSGNVALVNKKHWLGYCFNSIESDSIIKNSVAINQIDTTQLNIT